MAKTIVVNTATFQLNVDVIENGSTTCIALPPKTRIVLENGQSISPKHLNEFKQVLKLFEQPEENNTSNQKPKKELKRPDNNEIAVEG